MDFEVNQKQLAELLSITARQVRNLKDQGLFEFTKGTKKYNAPRCVAEYIEFKTKGELNRGTKVNREREMAEHERIKKEISAEKLRRLRKESHSAADVEAFLVGMLSSFRNRILAIPSKVAPLILGEDDINIIIAKLKKECTETLDELSEYDPEAIDGEPDEDEPDEEDGEE